MTEHVENVLDNQAPALIVTAVGLEVRGDPPAELYESFASSIRWAIGDWLVLGGERYSRRDHENAAKALALSRKTLSNIISVARKFPPEKRRPELSWSHHAAVVALPDVERERLLEVAVDLSWTVRELRRQVKRKQSGAE